MNVRLLTLSLTFSLTTVQGVSAAVVIHEFSGVISFSSVTGVAVDDPLIAVLTYDTDQPDLEPVDLSMGRYGEFTLSLDVGPISVSQTNPVGYKIGIIDRAPGSGDVIIWAGAIGPGDIGLRADDVTGTAFDSDALPLSLNISSFNRATVRHFVSGSTRVDGRILSISSRIVPEPPSIAIIAFALSGCLMRRFPLP